MDEDDDVRFALPENSDMKLEYKRDQVSVETIIFSDHHSTLSFRHIHTSKQISS